MGIDVAEVLRVELLLSLAEIDLDDCMGGPSMLPPEHRSTMISTNWSRKRKEDIRGPGTCDMTVCCNKVLCTNKLHYKFRRHK